MKRTRQVILLLTFILTLLLIRTNLLNAQEKATLFIDNLTTNVVEEDLLKSLNDHLKNHFINSGKFHLFTRDMHELSKADLTVKGSLIKIGDNYILNLRLIGNQQNITINTIRDKRRGEDLLTGIENASDKLLGLSFPKGLPVDAKDGPAITPPLVAPLTGGDVSAVLPDIEPVLALTGFGFLYIKSEPPGASIFLNDEKAGQTPRSLEMLDAGRYTVRIEGEGYFQWEDKVIVSGGSLIRINAELKTIYGSIAFDSIPQDAEVYINGKYEGQTPVEVGKLVGGSYAVEIKRLGYDPMSGIVGVKAGEITEIHEKIAEKEDHRKYRLAQERRRGKQIWAWSSLITSGLLAGKAFIDYSNSKDAYADSDAAYAGYLQSTDSSEVASYRSLSISKKEEGDKKASDGNKALFLSAAIAGLSSYHFLTMPPDAEYSETAYFSPQIHDDVIYLAWIKRY